MAAGANANAKLTFELDHLPETDQGPLAMTYCSVKTPAQIMQLSWLSRITARYAIVLVAATLLPVMIIVVAYDRYASGLVNILTGTQLEQRVAIMHSRLASFMEEIGRAHV